jgi:SAM-dependent methyltransferase
MAIEPAGPNAEQIRYWNEISGPKWVALHERVDAQIAPLGRLALDRSRLRPGARVLDVGCGCGATTVEIARRVTPGGAVTGVDVSDVMLDVARTRAHDVPGVPIAFLNADAQTHAFEGGAFDLVFSRFGVMFFAEPAAAFRNLHAALAPGGRLAFVCWQALGDNPWMMVPLAAAASLLDLPPPPAPDAPGPFSFADTVRVRGILERAGFAEVGFEAVYEDLLLGGGGDFDATIEFLLQMGPTGAAIRQADPARAAPVAAAVREALGPWVRPEGVRMGSAAWIVTASAMGARGATS